MNAIVPAETAARAFLQATLLRRCAREPRVGSLTALADELGRDKSNTLKTLKGVIADGLLTRYDDLVGSGFWLNLTPIGERALLALDVAEGSADVGGGADLLFLKHRQIKPNPLNPRTEFDEDAIAELAESIAAVDQVLVPLIVFPANAEGDHFLAAGERRWRAVDKLINDGRWDHGRPLPCLEREEDPAQAALIGLIENGQRVDLNLWDQAQAYLALMEATGWSAREAALKTGKSPRAVQEAVQVARNADPEQVAAFKRGSIKWEDLRNGVRKPAEKPLIDLVVSDHPDDVAELERRSSEARRQLAHEAAEARAMANPAAQIDVEELAPRPVELDVFQQLILREIEAAIAARPAKKSTLGPSVTLSSNLDVGAKGNADVAKLVSEGLIAVTGSWPTTVSLLTPGLRWLSSMPGAVMPLEHRLMSARKAAAMSDERRAELEAEGDFATEWLNVVKPPKPPELSDAEALILLELYDWTQRQKKDARHSGAPVRHDFDRGSVKALADRQLISGLHNYDYQDGLWRLSVGYRAPDALKARYADLEDAATRAKHKAALHATLAVHAPKGGNGYATPWLNGPIEPDPAFAEKKRQREEQEQVAEESRKKLEQARAQLAEAFAQLEADLATLSLDEARARLAAFLPTMNAPAPWAFEAPNYRAQFRAANGAALELYDGSGRIAQRLAVMALNLVAGVAPANWATSGELTRSAFEGAIADAILKAVATGEPDVPMGPDRARELAKTELDEMLERNGILFGDEDWDWTSEGADEIASTILTELEQAVLEREAGEQ